KASGVHGKVTYKGVKIEGSEDITLANVARYGKLYRANGSNSGCFESAPAISHDGQSPDGGRGATFEQVGDDVNSTCSNRSGSESYPHLYVYLYYTPKTLGKQTATVTVYHDGNEEGFSTFTISGEAFWDTAVELTGTQPVGTAPIAPIENFQRVGLDTAQQ